MRRLPALLPLLVFAILVGALVLAMTRQGAQPPGFANHLNLPAPVTELPRFAAAAPFRSADWAGHAYLVNFFASWCPPCRAEQPALAALAQAQLPVIGIAYKDKPAAVAVFLQETGDPFILVADDAAGHAGIDWGVTGIPETFLIDRHGVIRFHQAGPLTAEIVDQQLLPLWRELVP